MGVLPQRQLQQAGVARRHLLRTRAGPLKPGAVLAAVKDAAAPLRGGLRPSLTAAVRSACENSGRGGETALSRTEKHQISPATGCRYPHQTARRHFCYPIANENDPERAVRAAMEIVRGITDVPVPTEGPLRVRIALATGRTIVGDLDAGGPVVKDAATGSILNLAARLQTLAPPNGIIVSERTHARIQSRFECEGIGPVDLRGFQTPQQPWRIIRERPWQQGAETRPRRLTQLYGRDTELDVLGAQWSQVEQGRGRAVMITGEAGIGKSRLVEHMLDRFVPKGTNVIHLTASAFDEDSPLRPIVDYFRATAGLDSEDSSTTALAKLEAILVGDPRERRRALPIVAVLTGISVDIPVGHAAGPVAAADGRGSD